MTENIFNLYIFMEVDSETIIQVGAVSYDVSGSYEEKIRYLLQREHLQHNGRRQPRECFP